jgi:hypothetical protein
LNFRARHHLACPFPCPPRTQGMPHKWYQGKTGVVWNVTKRALGVEINKRVGLGAMHSHLGLHAHEHSMLSTPTLKDRARAAMRGSCRSAGSVQAKRALRHMGVLDLRKDHIRCLQDASTVLQCN